MSTHRSFVSLVAIYLAILTQAVLPILPTSRPSITAAVPATLGSRVQGPRLSPELERTRAKLRKQIESIIAAAPQPGGQNLEGGGPEPKADGQDGELTLDQRFGYDAKGNLIWRVDANGQRILLSYNELDQALRIDYPDGASTSYTYDDNKNRTSMTDSTGTTRYEYDALGRLVGISYPDGLRLGMSYDNLSRISLLSYVDGTTVAFTYYQNGQIKIVDRGGHVTTFTYNSAGSIESKTLSNGCRTLYHYDDFGRLVQIRHEAPGGQLISQFDYLLDKYGNRTQITKSTGSGSAVGQAQSSGKSVVLGVVPTDRPGDQPVPGEPSGPSADPQSLTVMTAQNDEMGRLTKVTYPSGRVGTYTFDAFNNRTSMTEIKGGATTTTTYEFDINNRLLRTRINGNVDEEFTYDGNGNMTARKRFGQITRYEWDFENRLKAVTKPSGERIEYAYNGEGHLWQRQSKYLVGVRTTHFYNTDSPDMPMILNEYTLETGRMAAHVYSGDTIIESQVREGSSNAYAAYLVGEFNAASITELRDLAGRMEFGLNYSDVYGLAEPNIIVGALAPGYIGEFYDPESHLQFLRARWYDPTLAIFISPDPKAPSLSKPSSVLERYAYGHHNPLISLDKTGMSAEFWSAVLGLWDPWNPWDPGNPPTPLFDASRNRDWPRFGDIGLETKWRNDATAHRPGGVRLNKSAQAYKDIGEVIGATFDPNTGQIILYGKQRKGTTLPGMRMDDLAVAIRMLFDFGLAPEISLDPVSCTSPPVPCSCDGNNNCAEYHKWRYGPPDRPWLMAHTHMGRVMMEADRVLKYLTLGRKPWATNETLAHDFIPGYVSWVDLMSRYPCWSGGQRWWLHPDQLLIDRSEDGSSIKFVQASMMLSTEEVFFSGISARPTDINRDAKLDLQDVVYLKSQLAKPLTADNWRADLNRDGRIDFRDLNLIRKMVADNPSATPQDSGSPAAADFVAWWNTHWTELKAYDFTPDDLNDPNIFQELEDLAKVIGIVNWIKDNNIPFDTSWVNNFDVTYTEHNTPEYNPTMTFSVPCGGGSVTVTGGVRICKDLELNGATVPPPVLSDRPSESTMGWTFVDPRDHQEYKAVGISTTRRDKDGANSRSDKDLSVDGRAGKLELTRYYNSFEAGYDACAWTWEAATIRPKGKGTQTINCNGTVLFGSANIYFTEAQKTTEFRFGGIYDNASDPQNIMTFFGSFDPSTTAVGYFDAGILGDPYFFLMDGTIYADFSTVPSDPRLGPRSGWLYKNRGNDQWMFFNLDGQLLWATDRQGNKTTYSRDAQGRLLSISDGTANISLTYSGGRLSGASASNGTAVTYGYDGNGFLSSSRLDTGQRMTYSYDGDGLLISVIDENGREWSGSANDIYGRAASSRAIGFSDPFSKSFNLDTKTTQESGPLGNWTTQYNERYLPTRSVDPLGHETEMVWNDHKQLIARIEGKGTTAERRTDYFYYSDGDLLALRRPNGVAEITIREADGRISTSLYLDSSSTFLTDSFDPQHIWKGTGELDEFNDSDFFDYTYTSGGQLEKKTAALMGFDVEQYTYDAQGRMLTSADGENHVLTYTYAGTLKRPSKITNARGEYVAYVHDGRDRTTLVTNGILPVHYEYDSRGRVSAVVQGEPGAYGSLPDVRHRTEYTFDGVYGLLTSVKSPNQVLTQYTYSSQNLLQQITHNGRAIYTYLYDGAGRVTGLSFVGTAGGTLNLEKGWFYDINASGVIDDTDLGWFATGWMKSVGDPSIQYPANARYGLTYDFDGDGFIGPKDLSFFASGWMRNSTDSRVVSPPVALAY